MVPKEFDVAIDDEEENDDVSVKEDAWNDTGVDFQLNESNLQHFALSVNPLTSAIHHSQSALTQF